MNNITVIIHRLNDFYRVYVIENHRLVLICLKTTLLDAQITAAELTE